MINTFLVQIGYFFFNKYGNVLNNFNVPSSLPIKYFRNFSKISGGRIHSLAIDNGRVYSFGDNMVNLF